MLRWQQLPKVEQWNVLTHWIGIPLTLIAWLIWMQPKLENMTNSASLVIYVSSMLFLFAASGWYHFQMENNKKHRARILDHIGIFFLIAGTYTPVCALALPEAVGEKLLVMVWSIGAIGVIKKIFFTGKWGKLSLFIYLLMGWLVVWEFPTIWKVFSTEALLFLALGGFFFTVGSIFYAIKSNPYFHVVWHVMVLLGVASHFIMIYLLT